MDTIVDAIQCNAFHSIKIKEKLSRRGKEENGGGGGEERIITQPGNSCVTNA